MKYALVLLLTTLSTATAAQPVYRCENSNGGLAMQDHPCATQSGQRGTEQDMPGALYATSSHRNMAFFAARADADSLRVKNLLKHAPDSNAAQYLENHRRCVDAMRIVAMCGTVTGRFSCNAKGFQREPEDASDASVMDQSQAFNVGQCALRASHGNP